MPRIKIREVALFEAGHSVAEVAQITGQTIAQVEAKLREWYAGTDPEAPPEA